MGHATANDVIYFEQINYFFLLRLLCALPTPASLPSPTLGVPLPHPTPLLTHTYTHTPLCNASLAPRETFHCIKHFHSLRPMGDGNTPSLPLRHPHPWPSHPPTRSLRPSLSTSLVHASLPSEISRRVQKLAIGSGWNRIVTVIVQTHSVHLAEREHAAQDHPIIRGQSEETTLKIAAFDTTHY